MRLASALRSAFPGAVVALAGSFDEASARIAAQPETDLVILDLDMPGMQGLAGVAALRALIPTAPLVIVSATRNPAAMRQAVEMGAAGFIPKSAPMDEIVASVRAAMRGRGHAAARRRRRLLPSSTTSTSPPGPRA